MNTPKYETPRLMTYGKLLIKTVPLPPPNPFTSTVNIEKLKARMEEETHDD